MSIPDDVRDRARGALVGLAVGDALGATLEFTVRPTDPRGHREMIGGGAHRLEPGQYTDDASMALALADSLLSRRGLDPADLMYRWCMWRHDGAYSSAPARGCFDVGNQMAAALTAWVRGCLPPERSGSDGNGSIMRLAPVALAAASRQAASYLGEVQGALTHPSELCRRACHGLANDLYATVHGQHVAWGNSLISRRGVLSTGFVADTMRAAYWAVDTADNFEDAVVLAVNLGGDADTVGAVAGQLAGARWGYAAIPERWRRALVDEALFVECADQLIELRLNYSLAV